MFKVNIIKSKRLLKYIREINYFLKYDKKEEQIMDLAITFLRDNWFAISGLIALLGATWRISNTLSEYKTSVKEHHSELQNKSDEAEQKINEKLDEFKLNIDQRIDDIERRMDDNDEQKIDATIRTKLIMDGVEATLVTLHNQGANGPVTQSLKSISEYKSNKASQW